MRIVSITLLLSLIFTGCSDDVLVKIGTEEIILAFGDSLTAGVGSTAGNDYPAVLETLVERRVVNAGIPGEITAEGLQRFPALLEQYKPALVILCHGGNDLLRRLDKNGTRENLIMMIQAAQERQVQVIIIGVPKPGIFLSAAPVYSELAEKFDIPLENRILAKIISERTLKTDQVHPNNRGYRLIAESIADLIKDSGML